jgi:exosome complex RNA-binding protein Rrp42 (RNase PH superfamily)
LDATLIEEAAASKKMTLNVNDEGYVCGIEMMGEGEIESGRLESLIEVGHRSLVEYRGSQLILVNQESERDG